MVTLTIHQFPVKKTWCPQRWATCILLARSTFTVVLIWLHSLEEMRNSCAGSKWWPHRLMLPSVQTNGELHSLVKGTHGSAGINSPHVHDHMTPNEGCHNRWAGWRSPIAGIWPSQLPILQTLVNDNSTYPSLRQQPHRAKKKKAAVILVWKQS